MASIYRLIEADHKTHRALLEAITGTQGDFAMRRSLWDQFYYDVKAHAAAEEETFYSNLMSHPDGQERARHSVAEHMEMDDLMDELNAMDLNSSDWLDRFATLREEYEHHIDEEENEIFARARDVFADKQADEFGERFAHRKQLELELVDEKSEQKLEA